MKITINFSPSAYATEFVNNSKSIKSSVTVELTQDQIEALTPEQRMLLLTYTASCKDTKIFDEHRYLIKPYYHSEHALLVDDYTEDVIGIINHCEELIKKSHEDAICDVAAHNEALKIGYNSYSMADVEVYYVERNNCYSRFEDSYKVRTGCIRIFSNGKSRDEMQKTLAKWKPESDSEYVVPKEVIISQLLSLSNKVYVKKEAEEEAERKAKEEEDRKKAEERSRQVQKEKLNITFMKEWAQQYGSDYLKNLIANDFDYVMVFNREYAEHTYGECHLGNEECYEETENYYGKTWDKATKRIDTPTEEHLNKFLEYQSKHPGVNMCLCYLAYELSEYDTMKEVEYSDDVDMFAYIGNDPHIGKCIYVEL